MGHDGPDRVHDRLVQAVLSPSTQTELSTARSFKDALGLNATVPLLVLTARPYRHRDHLVDLPGQLTQVAEATGLMLYERNAALLVGLREDRLVPRPSFFQLNQVRKARAHGLPLRIIAHEDVLVFRQTTNPPS